MPLLPVALYGLEVPCGDILTPAVPDFPATFRITMAAIDPSEAAEVQETANGTTRPRATLKIVRQPQGSNDDEESQEYMRALLAESDSDDDSEEEEEETNGGPSDPTKSKKARKAAALQQLMESLGGDSDDDIEDAPSGTKAAKKGKAKASSDDEEESDEESDDDEEEIEVEEFVLCTLDPEKNYQQPLDITIAENERVFFKVSGTHTIYLTGNYVVPDDHGHNHHHEVYDSEDDEDDEDYDLSPDEDELEIDEDESDDLDALEDPRITEVDSDDEEAPKLVAKKDDKKGKNKRSADEITEAASLDDIMAKSLKPEADEEPKLSKKQLKKLKKNNGEAAPAKVEEAKKDEAKKSDAKDVTLTKGDKKVQFAKNLEQGPTGSAEKAKASASDSKIKTVNGVKIEDKKVGSGSAAKKGNRVGMRYIGKLNDGKVFDSNKKGPPFTFKLGSGEVIQGWDIGIAGMQVGGERRITVPAHLAYGSKSLPGIPANSTLVFDVKMMSIK